MYLGSYEYVMSFIPIQLISINLTTIIRFLTANFRPFRKVEVEKSLKHGDITHFNEQIQSTPPCRAVEELRSG